MSRPTQILIDISALQHNCQLAHSLSPSSKTVAVIKADAYGHGAIEIARALQNTVAMFAVSSLDEAMELRADGIRLPVLLLEGCFSADELQTACSQGFHVVMHNQEQLAMLNQLTSNQHVVTWLKVDTGMHRLGFDYEQAITAFDYLNSNVSVSDIVLMTHMSVADELDDGFTNKQLQRFNQCHQAIEKGAGKPVSRSIGNSAAISGWPEARADWDRPGIMLYGLSPFENKVPECETLQPVMTFQSQVIALRKINPGETVGYGNTWQAQKPSTIATVAVGYGDGYPRNAKSGTPVIVNGQRGKLCGRVSMDMITVDVTGLDNIQVNSEVELWGNQLSANEVARWADTIGYELVTRMPKRTRRKITNHNN
ncbi:MAG: alanine racemase [Aliiglaciecola sp.]